VDGRHDPEIHSQGHMSDATEPCKYPRYRSVGQPDFLPYSSRHDANHAARHGALVHSVAEVVNNARVLADAFRSHGLPLVLVDGPISSPRPGRNANGAGATQEILNLLNSTGV
jgi:hypothetical protein